MSSQQEQYNKQRRASYHQNNLASQNDADPAQAELLRSVSEIDNMPADLEDDETMGQLVSSLTSTANLSEEEVRSKGWESEITQIFHLSKQSRPDGAHGPWSAIMHGDKNAYDEPMSVNDRHKAETYVNSSKTAMSRSKGFTAAKEVFRSITESLVHEDGESDDGGNGLLGMLRR